MDSLYSGSLLLALVAGSAAVLAGVAALVTLRSSPPDSTEGTDSRGRGPWLTGLARWLAAVSFVALGVSVTAHLGWGHRPGGPDALSPAAFLRIHPAFLVAGALAAAGALLAWAARTHPRRHGGAPRQCGGA